MLSRSCPFLILACLDLLFYAALVLKPAHVLYSDHSDLIAEHIPAKRFLVQSWRETGSIPLWCPYSYAGTPWIHDPQVAAFYPLHLPLFLTPEEYIGPVLSWLIVLHSLVAGWCMYVYARDQNLTILPSLAAACGYMFAGRWLLHLLGGGHYITIGLAWLPLILLCQERAIRRRRLFWATAAGVIYAFLILGTHPQWTFYAGILIALWTLAPALEEAGFFGSSGLKLYERSWKPLYYWLGYGLWMALLAVGLAAVQLLPTWEAASASTRTAGVDAGDVLMGGIRSFLFSIGPALTNQPPNLVWEDRGGFGFLWIMAAACAPLLGNGRIRYQAGVCLALLLFSWGGAAALQSLPGFRLFRQHARMILIAALPVAFLAGVTLQALVIDPDIHVRLRQSCRSLFVKLWTAAVILTGGFALRLLSEGKDVRFEFYWPILLVTVPTAYWLLGSPSVLPRRYQGLIWCLVLLVDLLSLAWPLVHVRAAADLYARSDCIEILVDQRHRHGRVLDRDAEDSSARTPLGAGAPLAMLNQLEPVRGYNPLDNRRYKEYLQFISDQDESLQPLQGGLTYPVISNFPIRNKTLIDLLGVRYLLQPSSVTKELAGWRPVLVDSQPRAYDFIDGGMQSLPSYTLYENTSVLPRAFVVSEAVPLPERNQVLAALKATDFRRTVLLEDFETVASLPRSEPNSFSATVREYFPNRIVLDVGASTAGYLILTDLWYPGWQCAVNQEQVRIHRANYLFRAVSVPAGRSEVVFTFVPHSYYQGRGVSLGALVLVLGVGLACAGRQLFSRRN